MKTVTLTIDGIQVTVPEGTVIVDAAKRAGIDIPVFCYHPKMAPVGMCRMCLVDVGRPVIDRATNQPVLEADGTPKIQFGRTLETGCTVVATEGMVVRHSSPKVEAGRHDILEFLLTSHPLDCPICDKGGECPLQNLTMAHGPGESRFLVDDKIKLAKHVPLGELIFLDRERCIQCARCTRFQSEIVDDPVIGFYSRGRKLEIQTHSNPGFDSYWSGNTTDICPVGALTTADFRFGARPWELNQAASICTQCPVGCNITFNTRREAKSGGRFVIKRVMPRQNEQVNEIWICDKGRFSTYQYTESKERLTAPLVRKDGVLTPVTWGEALDLVGEKLPKETHTGMVTLASGRLSNEDLFNLARLTEALGGKAVLDDPIGGGDLVASFGLAPGSNLGKMGKGDAILVVACDLEEEAPVWWLRVKQASERGATVIVINPRPTKLDKAADYKLRYVYGGEVAEIKNFLKQEHPAAKAFAGAENAVIFFGAEGLGLAGSQKLAEACAVLLAETGHYHRPNNGLVGVWSRPNTMGAWELGFRPEEKLAETLAGASVLLVAGADPAGDTPALASAVDQAGFVIVQDLFLTETARRADVVLPVTAFTGREGSLVSGERRVQRYYLAVPDLPETRPDFTIAAQLALRIGLQLEGRLPARVFQQIAQAVPTFAGLSYITLAQVEEQWPIVGRGDLYYGGTTYENSQGLGVHLSLVPVDHPATQEEAPGLAARVFDLVADVAEFVADVADQVADAIHPGMEFKAVPVTVLYDQGTLLKHTTLLSQRLAQPHVVMHPADFEKLGIQDPGGLVLEVEGTQAAVQVELNEDVPRGYLLAPRSLGLGVFSPAKAILIVTESKAATAAG